MYMKIKQLFQKLKGNTHVPALVFFNKKNIVIISHSVKFLV
jgi:hypothetical protein